MLEILATGTDRDTRYIQSSSWAPFVFEFLRLARLGSVQDPGVHAIMLGWFGSQRVRHFPGSPTFPGVGGTPIYHAVGVGARGSRICRNICLRCVFGWGFSASSKMKSGLAIFRIDFGLIQTDMWSQEVNTLASSRTRAM